MGALTIYYTPGDLRDSQLARRISYTFDRIAAQRKPPVRLPVTVAKLPSDYNDLNFNRDTMSIVILRSRAGEDPNVRLRDFHRLAADYTGNNFLVVLLGPSFSNFAPLTGDGIEYMSFADTDAMKKAHFHARIMERYIELETKSLFAYPDIVGLQLQFAFPKHLSTACEQYLLFFGKFLQEIGIAATANIDHKASRVLFSVVPDDPEEALEAIYEALKVYLNLPLATYNVGNTNPLDMMAAQELTIQLDFFKTQLQSAQAVGQLKDMTIQSQNYLLRESARTIDSQQALIDNQSIFITSLKTSNVVPAKTDDEHLVGGLVELGKWDTGKGIKINIAEMYRRGREWVDERRSAKKLELPKKRVRAKRKSPPKER